MTTTIVNLSDYRRTRLECRSLNLRLQCSLGKARVAWHCGDEIGVGRAMAEFYAEWIKMLDARPLSAATVLSEGPGKA
jgi:hypothetical protein